eukprot:scaffold2227_cov168-Amphora_coffeaeformis.AAC.9
MLLPTLIRWLTTVENPFSCVALVEPSKWVAQQTSSVSLVYQGQTTNGAHGNRGAVMGVKLRKTRHDTIPKSCVRDIMVWYNIVDSVFEIHTRK